MAGGNILIAYAPVAQLDRVSDYESEGREFESLPARQEKRTCVNKCVFQLYSPVDE